MPLYSLGEAYQVLGLEKGLDCFLGNQNQCKFLEGKVRPGFPEPVLRFLGSILG